MRQIAALFTQQKESNDHVQTRSIAEVQSNSQGETVSMNTDNQANVTEKEIAVEQVANEALNLAAPFLPGGAAAAKVAEFTGLAPAAIHLGFLFAHLFSHPRVAPIVAAAAPPPPPAPAPDPRAEAIAAIQKQMKDLQEQLAKLES